MVSKSEHHEQCKQLGKKVMRVMNGESTAVGIEVLVVTISTIIADCVDEENHARAAIDVMQKFMECMSKISPSFNTEMRTMAVPMEELVDILSGADETKH